MEGEKVMMVTLFLVLDANGKPCVAYPRRVQSEVYVSGFSNPSECAIEEGTFEAKKPEEMADQEIGKLTQENATLCSILDELANEFMEGDGEGRFVYPKRPGLARMVNEILKL